MQLVERCHSGICSYSDYLLWDALLSLWTWLCIFQAGLLGDWLYLALQHALNYSDLMGLCCEIVACSGQMAKLSDSKPGGYAQNRMQFGWAYPGMLVDLL